ncbi:LOW QUALITY PROTEIN: uncharacterized protein EMH_0023780 [Eimeria mitis]|uniref:Uncharacterized protein n=1 Tax=Eimeria mitis TaxID=44415 RepID=U6KE73_9EIME|nr:LOW QUALITY PROTEIN: uncharacterized protein EMH_0023780 [Eimeria mitis]CDJ35086.1 hypothetical protein, conserved [Eimeria mitis]
MGADLPDAAVSVAELEQEAPEAVAADAGDYVLQENDAHLLRKSPAGYLKVIIPLLLVLGALLLAERKIGSRDGKVIHRSTPFLTLEDADIERYREELNEAAKEMEEAWKNSEPLVRETFTKYFIPSGPQGESLSSGDPVENLRAHVEEMRKSKVPGFLSLGARKDYSLHLRLLKSLCVAVVDRLQQVEEMQQQNEEVGVPVAIDGRDMPYSFPSLDDLKGEVESGMRAKEFLELVGRQACPLALSSSAKANYVVPYTKTTFETFTLWKLFEKLYPEHFVTPRLEFEAKVRRIGRTWSSDVALEEAKKQQKEYFDSWEKGLELRRKLAQEQMEKGMRADDLLIYCLFLL